MSSSPARWFSDSSTPCRIFSASRPRCRCPASRPRVKVDYGICSRRVEAALKAGGIVNQGTGLDSNSVKVRFADTDTQLKAKDVLSQSLNPERDDPAYVVALNLLSSSPNWLTAIDALPDVPGPGPARRRALPAAGGHERGADQAAGEPDRGHPRRAARQERALSGISREGNAILLSFRDADTRAKARKVLEDNQPT